MIVPDSAQNRLGSIRVLTIGEGRGIDRIEVERSLVGIRHASDIDSGSEAQSLRVAAGAGESEAGVTSPELPPTGHQQSLISLLFIVVANRPHFSGRQTERRILSGHFHSPVRGGNRSLHGSSVRKEHVYRLVRLDGRHLIPGCGDNTELVGLDGEALAVFLDDGPGDLVAVLQHYLVRPRGTYRETHERWQEHGSDSDGKHIVHSFFKNGAGQALSCEVQWGQRVAGIGIA